MKERTSLTADLAALDGMASHQLRAAWTDLTGKPCPRISPAMLRLALGFEMQARAQGGHSRRTTRKLDQMRAGKSETREARPGMRLVREWNGTLHVVTIGEDGAIQWNERSWASLSKVAREITGTRWSGPAFFGLKQARLDKGSDRGSDKGSDMGSDKGSDRGPASGQPVRRRAA